MRKCPIRSAPFPPDTEYMNLRVLVLSRCSSAYVLRLPHPYRKETEAAASVELQLASIRQP